jgi:hypothetical protein
MPPHIRPVNLLRQALLAEHVIAGNKLAHTPLRLQANAAFCIHDCRKDIQVDLRPRLRYGNSWSIEWVDYTGNIRWDVAF